MAISFSQNYASMGDDELQRLSHDMRNLVPEAREALQLEMERRHLQAEDVHGANQPARQLAQQKPAKPGELSGVFGRFMRNLLIFAVCDIALGAVLVGVLANVRGIDFEKLGEGMVGVFAHVSLAASLLIARPVLKLRTVWTVGMIGQPGIILVVLLAAIVHLQSFVIAMIWLGGIGWIIYGLCRDRDRQTAQLVQPGLEPKD